MEHKIVNGETIPLTKEELSQKAAKEKEWQQKITDYEANEKYKDDRVKEYPDIKEQLDMIWHAMDQGQMPKAFEWYYAVKNIKDKYPKPQ